MTLIADKIIAAANRRHQFQSTKSGKRRLLTLKDLDSRTRATRQALALRDGFLSDLGGGDRASVAQQELAQRGAILGVMIEDQEARWLRGDGVELAEYCTLVNAQRRVLADIGLERRARDVTPSLHGYLEAVRHAGPGEPA